ncbi:hypothetical protein [Streptomyces sp. SPB074]|uniref:hypothetical protein n=1 Tax=Streptomyces sp. (strain SPB074) TaxID=465543 RepID=UPI0001D1DF1D|nr:hypothetical protein [Streptomyces sp. SPB074]EFG64348.1 hypothetical protein SSBG_05130 [Streptomyces sp. SPB074]
MNDLNGSAQDEHRRFAHYRHELAVVRVEDEADLVTGIRHDPDKAMVQPAIIRHLDRLAVLLLTDAGCTAWARAMAEIIAEREFLARRLRE